MHIHVHTCMYTYAYIYMYPFFLKLWSHPGCCITMSRAPGAAQ